MMPETIKAWTHSTMQHISMHMVYPVYEGPDTYMAASKHGIYLFSPTGDLRQADQVLRD
jgi:hypothetical protein